MKMRIVVPEILDHLPHDDPAARRSRMDLRLVNFLMGNERWVLRMLRKFPQLAALGVCEIGAGDGILAGKIQLQHSSCRVTACDLAPRPAGLDESIDWRCGDLFENAPPAGGVLVANLFLHHFEGAALRQIGQMCTSYRLLIFSEPDRSEIAAFLGKLLHPFVNHVTRHDMQVSIRAGFREGEMAEQLGLDRAVWRIDETSTWRGARRVVAWHA